MNIFLTGASGFVGKHLCRELSVRGLQYRASSQRSGATVDRLALIETGPLQEPKVDLAAVLKDTTCVVHLAGFAHESAGSTAETERKLFLSNEKATEVLLAACQRAGVKRFIYVSSVKACGETSGAQPISENTPDNPTTAYGFSKLRAEKLVIKTCIQAGIEFVILRPTLVYGPDVKANFLGLLRLVKKWPVLPLNSLKSKRNFCYVGNLVDALIYVLSSHAARNRVYYVADRESLLLKDLFRSMQQKMGNRYSTLVSAPAWLFYWGSRLVDGGQTYRKIFSSLEVSTTLLSEQTGWKQPFTFEEGLDYTINWFLNLNNKLVSHENVCDTNHTVFSK